MLCKALGQGGKESKNEQDKNPCPITQEDKRRRRNLQRAPEPCQDLGRYQAQRRRPDSEGEAQDRPRGREAQEGLRVQNSRTACSVREGNRRTHFSWPKQKGMSWKVAGKEAADRVGSGAGQDVLHPQSEEPEACPAGHRETAGAERLLKENKFVTAMDFEEWYQLGSCRNNNTEK